MFMIFCYLLWISTGCFIVSRIHHVVSGFTVFTKLHTELLNLSPVLWHNSEHTLVTHFRVPILLPSLPLHFIKNKRSLLKVKKLQYHYLNNNLVSSTYRLHPKWMKIFLETTFSPPVLTSS